jgi:hypothetical protein
MLIFPSFFNASAGGYEIEQSLRFDGSSRFNKTFASSGNRKTFTISFWVKNTTTTIGNVFNQARTNLRLNTTNAAFVVNAGYGGTNKFLTSNASFRDPSAWYHFVLVFDTTQSTESNRVKIWVNNQLQTYSSASYPPQNQDLDYNSTEVAYIGAENTSEYLNGYLAEYHSIDGSALDPTSFGEYDDNGIWRPIRYTGSYGTNGFYLKFDPSATNGIGHDHSGNGNNWTPTGFNTNPTSYVLATKTSGTFSTGTLRDVFDASSGAAGGVYQEATTGSTAASTIDIEFDSPLSGTITVEASDGTGGTNNGGQYQLIDSTDTVQVTQARPTNTTTFTHTGLSDITKLRMYGGSSGLGGILISRFESSDQTIRSADWLALTDVLSDTPTANWATLNPVDNGGATLAEGNLSWDSGSNQGTRSTFFVDSGKWGIGN